MVASIACSSATRKVRHFQGAPNRVPSRVRGNVSVTPAPTRSDPSRARFRARWHCLCAYGSRFYTLGSIIWSNNIKWFYLIFFPRGVRDRTPCTPARHGGLQARIKLGIGTKAVRERQKYVYKGSPEPPVLRCMTQSALCLV